MPQVSIAPYAVQQFANAAGVPYANGRMYFYVSGTSTPKAAYTDSTGNVALPNPAILDAGGNLTFWLAVDGPYTIELRDQFNVVVPGYPVNGVTAQIPVSSVTNAAIADDTIRAAKLDDTTDARAIEFASTIKTQQLGAGATARTLLAKLRDFVSVQDYGAVGDGTTDDGPAFQAALNTGRDVYVPGVSASYFVRQRLNLTAVGQGVYGDGAKSLIVQGSTTPVVTNDNMTVFRAANLGRHTFQGLHLQPYSAGNFITLGVGTTQAFGIDITASDYSTVTGCYVSNHRRGGIMLNGSSYCVVDGNIIFDSVVTSGGGATQPVTGLDIYVTGNASYNIISNNRIRNGSGVGIGIQTLSASDTCNYNQIIGNTIFDQDLYGILLYILVAGSTVTGTLVQGNVIDGVTGLIPEAGGQFNYGAGINVQTADNTIVQGNYVRNTVTRSAGGGPVPDLNNTPGGIGISGVANCLVEGNIIENANWWGIVCVQATAYTAAGRGLEILNNKVLTTRSTAVLVQDVVNATIVGNRVSHSTSGPNGIFVRQAALSQSADFLVQGNRVENYGVGILTEGTITSVIMKDNRVRNNTGYALFSTAAFSGIEANDVRQASAGTGIGASAAAVDGWIRDNYVNGGTLGVVDDSGCTVETTNNQIVGATTAYSTSYLRVLANSTTPSVRNGRWFQRNVATNITNLTGGFQGQLITIRSSSTFTITSGSGIDLAGGVSFAVTPNDTLTLVLTGSSWTEVSRSVN